MSATRVRFEERAAGLADHAMVEVAARQGATTLRLLPRAPMAVGVVLYLHAGEVGTVALDDPASVPAELGEDSAANRSAVDHFIDIAVEGRATAYHLGGGGCIEVSEGTKASRSWHNAWPWPGWRRRAVRIKYQPYS